MCVAMWCIDHQCCFQVLIFSSETEDNDRPGTPSNLDAKEREDRHDPRDLLNRKKGRGVSSNQIVVLDVLNSPTFAPNG